MNHLLIKYLLEILFLTVVFFHITKKNFGVAIVYGLQSFLTVFLLLHYFYVTGDPSLLFIALVASIVKVALAPLFFVRLIKKHALKFSVSTYLNVPLTLIVIAALTATAHSQKLSPLTSIIPANQAFLSLALAIILLSLFLIVNRKGALSQIIGILSCENSIVVFATLAGLEQSPSLQIAILFNIFVWIMIATVFVSMVYRHFGSLNVTSMKHLID